MELKQLLQNIAVNKANTQNRFSILISILLLFSLQSYALGDIDGLIKKKVEKKFNVEVIKVSEALIDPVSKNGVYKATYIEKNDTLETSVVFVNKKVYFEIRNKNGLGPKYTKGYYKLKKYLTEEQMKEVNRFFLRKFPPNF